MGKEQLILNAIIAENLTKFRHKKEAPDSRRNRGPLASQSNLLLQESHFIFRVCPLDDYWY